MKNLLSMAKFTTRNTSEDRPTVSFPSCISSRPNSNKTTLVTKQKDTWKTFLISSLLPKHYTFVCGCRYHFTGIFSSEDMWCLLSCFCPLPDRKRSSLELVDRDFCCFDTPAVAWEEPGTLFSACRDGSTPETQCILVQTHLCKHNICSPRLHCFTTTGARQYL